MAPAARTAHSSPVAPRSSASSTANGRSVSPPAPLEASAPRRRGRPGGPACPLEPSVCAVALEPHACTSVRYCNPTAPNRHRAPNICCDKWLAQGCVFEPQAVAPEEQSSVTRIDGAGLAAHTSKRPFETTRTRRAHRVPRWLRLEGGTSHALQTDEGQHREDFKHNCGGFDQRREWHR